MFSVACLKLAFLKDQYMKVLQHISHRETKHHFLSNEKIRSWVKMITYRQSLHSTWLPVCWCGIRKFQFSF